LSNLQLADIDASLQAIVRRAYELGRGDALKKVVDALNADHPRSERLALMAPETVAQTVAQEEEAPAAYTSADAGSTTPWWARPVR